MNPGGLPRPRKCAMRCALFTFLGLSLLAPSNAEGQKNCRKGIPCGNTCIAANKVCHVGTPSTPPTTSSTPARSDSTTVAPTTNTACVAPSRGHTYYRHGCTTATRLSPATFIYFGTEEDASRARY